MQLHDIAPRPALLGAALLLIGGAILALEQPWAPHSSVPPAPAALPASELRYPAAPDFRGASGWLGEPQDLVALRGKVVLVDFWTYSCINCIHTFPHVEGWYERYREDGLVVVGVHTPEFRFEHEAANVQAATGRYGLTYPVALDNDYAVWRAYANRYWPAEYLIDAYGRVRHTHFGEEGYAETEQAIRDLLAEAGHAPRAPPLETGVRPDLTSHTPELYAADAEFPGRVALGNPEGYHPGATLEYERPASPERDLIWLVGTWANHDENVTAGPDASVLVRFRAGAGNAVLDGPRGACARVLLDGQPVNASLAARDVRLTADGPCLVLDGARSYDFYAGPDGVHTVELLAPEGLALFTFDFSPGGM
jgi:thiol-disulfide isomerase/thioredoxin